MARVADKYRAVQEAQLARRRLGVGLDSPVPDVLSLLEDVADIPVTLLPLPEGIAGALARKRDRHFIFINSGDYPVRRRFTLAHEFGHLTLGHRPVIDRTEDVEGKSDRRCPEEAEANYFAAEFLAPDQAVRSFAQARRVETVDLEAVVLLGAFFGISAKAARIRWEAIGMVPKPRDRQILDGEIDAGDHLRLQREVGAVELMDSLSQENIPLGERRLPKQVFRRVSRAYSSGLVTLTKLAEQVGIPPQELGYRLKEAGFEPPPADDED